jgi:hypothetical protein
MRKFEKISSPAGSEIWRSASYGPQGLTADIQTLRARAERYRRLAENLLCDPRIIAVVLACARELEAQATQVGKDHYR